MRCLVTGATGFVGSNIALELDRLGHEVIAIGAKGEQELEGFNGKIIYGNFYDLEWDSIGRVDCVLHQAAIVDTTFEDGDEMMRVNCYAAIDFFKKAIERGCRRIVYASSTAVYGHSPAPYKEGEGEGGANVYGKSKLALDNRVRELMKDEGVVFVGLRYCNVYGPRENHKGKMANMIYQLARQMLGENPKIFKNGEQKRDQIYVKDVVKANICAMNARESCIVNCGTGKPVTFNEVISSLNKVMDLDRETKYIDNPYGAFFQTHTECDMSLAKEKIGFEAEWDFVDGVEDYHKSDWLTKEEI